MKKLFSLFLLCFPLLSFGSDSFIKFISGTHGCKDISMIRVSSNQFILAGNDTSTALINWQTRIISVDSLGNVLWSFKKPMTWITNVVPLGTDSFVCTNYEFQGINGFMDVYSNTGVLGRSMKQDVFNVRNMIPTFDGGILVAYNNSSVVKLDNYLNVEWVRGIVHTYDPIYKLIQFKDGTYGSSGNGVYQGNNLDYGMFVRYGNNGDSLGMYSYRGAAGGLFFTDVQQINENKYLMTYLFTDTQCSSSASNIAILDSSGNILRDFHAPCMNRNVYRIYASAILKDKIMLLVNVVDSSGSRFGLMQVDSTMSYQSIVSFPIDVEDSYNYSMITDSNSVYFSFSSGGAIVFGKAGANDTMDCSMPVDSFYFNSSWLQRTNLSSATLPAGSLTFIDTLCTVNSDTFTSIDVCIALGSESSLTNNQFEIYPNPAQNNFSVSTKNADCISIFDATGKYIRRINVNAEVTDVSITDLSEGIYFVTVAGKSSIVTKRLLVIR